MRVLSVVCAADAGTGVFADEVRAAGHELEEWAPVDRRRPDRPLADYGALLAFGGGMHVDEHHRHPWLRVLFGVLEQALEARLPTLTVCLSAQALAVVGGGTAGPAPRAEWGWHPVELTPDAEHDALFGGLAPVLDVFQWHSYRFTLPPGAVALATSSVGLQALRLGPAAWGVQWHPEITAEAALLWADRYPPAPGGVPVAIDAAALRADVARRMPGTNAEGRALCGRFLTFAAAAGARRRAAA